MCGRPGRSIFRICIMWDTEEWFAVSMRGFHGAGRGDYLEESLLGELK